LEQIIVRFEPNIEHVQVLIISDFLMTKRKWLQTDSLYSTLVSTLVHVEFFTRFNAKVCFSKPLVVAVLFSHFQNTANDKKKHVYRNENTITNKNKKYKKYQHGLPLLVVAATRLGFSFHSTKPWWR